VLTQEQIIRIRAPSSNLEYLNQIVELPMYIPHNCNRCLYMYNIALLHQELLCFGAYCFDDGLGEEVLLIQALNTLIQVNRGCEV